MCFKIKQTLLGYLCVESSDNRERVALDPVDGGLREGDNAKEDMVLASTMGQGCSATETDKKTGTSPARSGIPIRDTQATPHCQGTLRNL